MGIFKSTDVVTTLKSKSASAISVFKTTVSDLKSINEVIDNEIGAVQRAIVSLEDTENELVVQARENRSFINKINEFLGVTE